MNRNQINRAMMFQTVVQHLKLHRAIWEGTKSVQDAFDDLQFLIQLTLEKIHRQHTPTAGATGEKEEVRVRFEAFTLEMANQLRALAARTKNIQLAAKTELVPSVVGRMAEDVLVAVARRILNLLTPNLPALADYGVTAKDITTLESLLEEYQAVKTASRDAIVGRRSETVTLPALFREMTRLLRDQLDNQLTRFRTSHPEFYAGYVAARSIIDRGGRSATLTAPKAAPAATTAEGNPQA